MIPLKPVLDGTRLLGYASSWEQVHALLVSLGASETQAARATAFCGVETPAHFLLLGRKA